MLEFANGRTANVSLNSDVSKGGEGKTKTSRLIYKSQGRIK